MAAVLYAVLCYMCVRFALFKKNDLSKSLEMSVVMSPISYAETAQSQCQEVMPTRYY